MKAHAQNRLIPAHQGFSLIELVVSIIILSLIAVTISNFLGRSVLGFTKSTNNISALSKLRYIDRRLAKELRLVNHDGAGSYDVVSMSNNTFEFTDTSGANNVTISYNGVDTLNITYTNPAASGDLGREVTAFNFNYFKSDGVSTPVPVDGTDLVFVEYNITVTENDASYTARSRVMLRDLK